MLKISRDGGRRRREFVEGGLDRRRPTKRQIDHPETAPYFYGPTPWHNHYGVVSRAREFENISSIQDMTLLLRILHEEEFSDARKHERENLFGPWSVEKHLVDPLPFNDELQFLPTNPDFFLAGEHMGPTEELGNRTTWLQSDLGPLVYGAFFAKLIGRDDCDVHIIGEEDFISDRLKTALVQDRPEHLKYLLHEPQGEGTANRPIELLRRPEKRFWMFFMHNASTAIGWSDNLRVAFSVAGASEDDEGTFHNRWNFFRIDGKLIKRQQDGRSI